MTEYIDLHIKLKRTNEYINIRKLEPKSAIAFVNALVEINKEILKTHKKPEFCNLIEVITID